MALNIGLNVVEVDGLSSPAISAAPTSVAGFNVLTQRGRPDTPTRVTSFQQFVERFGSYFENGLGAYLVDGFFKNGGHTAWINRIVSTNTTTGAVASTLNLQDRAGAPQNTLQLEAGFRGAADPGTWGDSLFVSVAEHFSVGTRIRETALATVQSTAPLAATIDMSAAPNLDITIDGEAEVLSFVPGDFPDAANATREQIVEAINSKTTSLTASLAPTFELVLTSTGETAAILNRWSSLEITAAHPPLNLAVAPPTLGTAAPITANGTILARGEEFVVGDAIRLRDGTVPDAFTKISTIDPATGSITWAPPVPTTFTEFETFIHKAEFDLTIHEGGIDPENIVENWMGLTMETELPNYVTARLNDQFQGSRYIFATDLGSASPAGINQPAAIMIPVPLQNGRDGTPTAIDFVGDSATRTGFFAFDPIQIQLLTSERTDLAIARGGIAYCAQRGDCLYVGSVPEGGVESGTAEVYGAQLRGKKVYGALYGPWVTVLDPMGNGANPRRRIPATGHILGAYSRIASSRGVWKAPAGDEADLRGVLDLETRLSARDHTLLVDGGGVNGILDVPGVGITIGASRTLSTDSRWLFVNVRLLFNFVESSLMTGLSWVKQEPNKDTLWSIIKYNTVTPFLMGLWRQGAFGTGPPSDVFAVIVDATNNPPAEVDLGNLTVEVYFYPNRPAERIKIIVGQKPSGAAVSES